MAIGSADPATFATRVKVPFHPLYLKGTAAASKFPQTDFTKQNKYKKIQTVGSRFRSTIPNILWFQLFKNKSENN
jgi:hypothetical protein